MKNVICSKIAPRLHENLIFDGSASPKHSQNQPKPLQETIKNPTEIWIEFWIDFWLILVPFWLPQWFQNDSKSFKKTYRKINQTIIEKWSQNWPFQKSIENLGRFFDGYWRDLLGRMSALGLPGPGAQTPRVSLESYPNQFKSWHTPTYPNKKERKS